MQCIDTGLEVSDSRWRRSNEEGGTALFSGPSAFSNYRTGIDPMKEEEKNEEAAHTRDVNNRTTIGECDDHQHRQQSPAAITSHESASTRKERIRKILSYQFDLEILHKLREVRVIEEELERGVAIKELIEKLYINGTYGLMSTRTVRVPSFNFLCSV